MEITIHDVREVRLEEIDKLEEHGTFTRNIVVESEKERLVIDMFGDKKENLQIKVQKMIRA